MRHFQLMIPSTSVDVDKYALPALMTMGGIYQCGFMARRVGECRMKHKVEPPETNGPPEFMRIMRAQQNHLEFYPLAVGCLWVGSVFFHPVPASLLYGGFLVGRERYFKGYVESADNRLPGFYMSLKFLRLLMLLGLVGAGHSVLRRLTGFDVFAHLKEARFPRFER